MDDIEKLGHCLGRFHSEFYEDAIREIRATLRRDEQLQDWIRITSIIRRRQLPEGQVLKLVNQRANQVLDENSDAEAYRWMDLMVANVETDSEIQPY